MSVDTGVVLADKELFDEVFSAVYEELRRLASFLKRHDRSVTLATTDIVDEAYLRMQGSPHLAARHPLHFRRIAGRAMRQILVDAARRRASGKRGENAVMVTLGGVHDMPVKADREMLELHAELEELARMEPRQGNILEMKYFGGFQIPEIADYLNLSESTVNRDLRVAEAWLKSRLRPFLSN